MEPTVIVRLAEPGDVSGIARVHVDALRSTYRGIIAESYLAGLRYADRERMWTDALGHYRERSVVYVAVDGDGEVIGFAAGGESDEPGFAGEIYAIYLLADRQRRGIGRRLMAAVARDLRTRGKTSLFLWVLAANPARVFYEAMGGRPIRSKPIEIGGEELEEVGYGWDDSAELLRLAGA